jgi:hypothetical protein
MTDHCIETEAKRELDKLMSGYFNMDGKKTAALIEEQIELISEFLKVSDFKKLRASDSRLSGGQKSEVLLYRDVCGTIKMDIS